MTGSLPSTLLAPSAFVEGDNELNYVFSSTPPLNYTKSGQRGPGRTLDDFFSRAGSALEQRLGKLAYDSGVGPYAKAERYLSTYDDKTSYASIDANKILLYAG